MSLGRNFLQSITFCEEMKRKITQNARFPRRRYVLAAVVVGLTFLPAHARNAQYSQNEKTVVGVLTCTAFEGHVERTATERLAISCRFQAKAGGYTEDYVGTLRRLAGKLPLGKPIALMWTVSADPAVLSPGVLGQSYLSSAPADAPESRQLQGQKNESIVLSPFSGNGNKAEHTVTVLDLDLKRTGA